jgi:hypothetical protein
LDKLMAGFQMQMTSISFVIAFANTIPFMSWHSWSIIVYTLIRLSMFPGLPSQCALTSSWLSSYILSMLNAPLPALRDLILIQMMWFITHDFWIWGWECY